MAAETLSAPRNGGHLAGDRVVIVDAPSWCRRYFTGQVGRVVRVLPFARGDVWVRFERPVGPWCDRMEPIEEFPFTRTSWQPLSSPLPHRQRVLTS